MFEKYIGRTLEIIYLDRKGKITQRNIEVWSVKETAIKAYCFEKQAPRIFAADRILAVMSVRRRYG